MADDRLFVKTRFADSLVNDLPDVGLTGVKVHDQIVRVEPSAAGDDPEDLKFELGWYADRLGIDGFWVGPAGTKFTPQGDPEGTDG